MIMSSMLTHFQTRIYGLFHDFNFQNEINEKFNNLPSAKLYDVHES